VGALQQARAAWAAGLLAGDAASVHPPRRVEGTRERHYARATLWQSRSADAVLALRYGRAPCLALPALT
jgi:hypothetical protein